MSVRNLDKLFKPRSVALIGATPRPGSVGARGRAQPAPRRLCRRADARQPASPAIDGLTRLSGRREPAAAPDLAVIVTPPETRAASHR